MSITTLQIAKNAAITQVLRAMPPQGSSEQCWNWTRYIGPNGYGAIRVRPNFFFAVHRLSFEHFKGNIPEGMRVMHDCDNRACFNPDHLFLGTHKENMQDMIRKRLNRLAALKSMAKKPVAAERMREEFRQWLKGKSA